jgi:hypothetical protein
VANFADQQPEAFRAWKRESNSIICLAADDEERLKREYARAVKLLGARVAFFTEPDIDDEWTAIAFYADAQTRRKFKHLGVAGRRQGGLQKTTTTNHEQQDSKATQEVLDRQEGGVR